eukprot:CAMPEP_0116877698 /NCGR_PEP_ID=MMETSP0463-20121206/9445_1 /TAXON_ID=181622 /ORGANISM="Strombidinopsis sp, Strain SopsisLIS2011" /LENGTH=182 /DNA_ID=CAMNT_0004525173 /DNA_START=1072 /DNA_END=1620 /DNA_ORIENTATION=-
MDQYLDALSPESPLERIAFRLQVAKYTTNKKDFLRLEKGTQGQIENETKVSTSLNDIIGFKCLHYSVAESSIHVNLVIEKKKSEEFTFWVKTRDGTALADEDYIPKEELITFKATEKERTIKIGLVDSHDWEPDEDFFVDLCDEQTKKRLDGDNTCCKVTILDDDNPGQLVFEKREIEVKRA